MNRAIHRLSQKVYDVAIIGGGIYGISVARDAAMRGLRVALVEQGDFGQATSANHHKIIHGGLRYLQHMDLQRMRESIRERTTLLRIAPHLVYPMAFLIPTYTSLLQGKLVLSIALRLNDLIGFDRNRPLDSEHRIPPGRILSKVECVRLCPTLQGTDLTGGALFFDAQIVNPDRLNLSLLLSAVRSGAEVANYVQVVGFLRQRNTVVGMQVRDLLSDDMFKVHARVVVNCAGPWMDSVLQLLGPSGPQAKRTFLKAAVLVTRPLVQQVAVGVSSRSRYTDKDSLIDKGHRYFFITPWRNMSLIGTFQAPYDGDPSASKLTEPELQGFIREVNAAFQGTALRRQDVYFVYHGLLPSIGSDKTMADGQLMKRYEIHDHEAREGISGLISVLGIKYTTARNVAEKTVDLVLGKLGRVGPACQTAMTPVPGGGMKSVQALMDQTLSKKPAGVGTETLRHLVHTYGSEAETILRYGEENHAWHQLVTNSSPVIKAQVIHAVREEMAQKLSDVICRRTDLRTAGYPSKDCLLTCAEMMASELGWDKTRVSEELEEVARSLDLGQV